MVDYRDPDDNPDLPRKGRSSPGERLARMRERNAALSGVEAIEAAREVALRQLDARSRSRAQLHTAITSRGFSSDIADEVLERLARVGLVDDAAYAGALVRDRFRGSGKVGRALLEDLRRRGIGEEDIRTAMDSIDPEDEVQRARELVESKRRAMAGVPRDVAWRRLSGALARKGYSSGVAMRVIRDALEEWDNDNTGD
ncbi:MAG: regulatory protein RecX [Actinomycetaceae bacterium]|nr:regulatory protein RecX [Actinomycetaceae bacterium]